MYIFRMHRQEIRERICVKFCKDGGMFQELILGICLTWQLTVSKYALMNSIHGKYHNACYRQTQLVCLLLAVFDGAYVTRGVFKKFGEWYQKTNKTEDTNTLTLLAFKIIAILHNTLLATFIKLLETINKGLFRNRSQNACMWRQSKNA
jgi:hypothetical protein